MLKTYRIIPLVFILFLFGLTLMTVSPVFAADSAAFKQCQQIKPQGKFGPMKQKKNCFRDVARALQDQSGDSVQSVAPAEPSGGEVAELNARIVESQSQVATLTTTNAQLQEQLRAVSAAAEPLNAKVATLESQLSEANAAQEPLNAKVATLESQLSGGDGVIGLIEKVDIYKRQLNSVTQQLKIAIRAENEVQRCLGKFRNRVKEIHYRDCDQKKAVKNKNFAKCSDLHINGVNNDITLENWKKRSGC